MARTVYLCGAKPAAQIVSIWAAIFMVLSAFFFFRNNISVKLKGRVTEQMIFSILKCICILLSNWCGIILVWHLSNIFCGVSPNLEGEMPQSPPHLPNGIRDMPVTWCKVKVIKTENTSRFKLINSTQKIMSSFLQNSADIHLVHTRHFPILNEQIQLYVR